MTLIEAGDALLGALLREIKVHQRIHRFDRIGRYRRGTSKAARAASSLPSASSASRI